MKKKSKKNITSLNFKINFIILGPKPIKTTACETKICIFRPNRSMHRDRMR